MQIRHNLVVVEKPFFRRGCCVQKTAYHLCDSAITGFWMKRVRLGLALAGMATSVAVGGALWPHARDAHALLAAREDPAELSSVQLDFALRNKPALIEENIEAALAAGDVDLAASFVELARERNIALGDELSKRVSEAVTEENSTSGIRKALCRGLCDRQFRRHREPVGHGGGRPHRVGRYQGRRARRKTSRHGRGDRSSDTGPGHRRPCRNGGDLRFGRRRDAAARRTVAGQGHPQGGTAERGPRDLGRPLGARNGGRARASESGRLRFGVAARRDDQCREGGVPCRKGRRAGAACQGRRPGRREGRHQGRQGHAEDRRKPQGRRPRRAAGRIQAAARQGRS